ncbi:3-hydroxyacyl-ACP dehydratase FabZ family protein [Amycolatopsis cihanbeyliensis]|uniref:3-hydroxyacyl-[acyl-carrier-protein] dehydratase n=1 Tax=Amycolatopsis cihanbeyliensis TaxID=1128664 RepID=A0A542DE54_AMYCI|nr:beta-hydroxyacyl-ACP dehydratase [Amycolatopsis cihanbeyliensis]TQJ01355.1 3-hydroxyacyl-[acyl-carrier-protein] dehydratase [Amycolatopsis cihanbeyliensis]
MLTTAELRTLLPRRYPILLLDRVSEVVPGEWLSAVKAITCNEPWYAEIGESAVQEDFAYPETLLLESWGQSAAIMANLSASGSRGWLDEYVMLFGGMSDVQVCRRAYPGDVVEHHVRVLRALSDATIFEGSSSIDGEPVLTVSSMVMAFRPAAELRPTESAAVSS